MLRFSGIGCAVVAFSTDGEKDGNRLPLVVVVVAAACCCRTEWMVAGCRVAVLGVDGCEPARLLGMWCCDVGVHGVELGAVPIGLNVVNCSLLCVRKTQ